MFLFFQVYPNFESPEMLKYFGGFRLEKRRNPYPIIKARNDDSFLEANGKIGSDRSSTSGSPAEQLGQMSYLFRLTK